MAHIRHTHGANLALILTGAGPEAEKHHHAVTLKPEHPPRAVVHTLR